MDSSSQIDPNTLILFAISVAILSSLTRHLVRHLLRNSDKSASNKRWLETLAGIGIIAAASLLLVAFQYS